MIINGSEKDIGSDLLKGKLRCAYSANTCHKIHLDLKTVPFVWLSFSLEQQQYLGDVSKYLKIEPSLYAMKFATKDDPYGERALQHWINAGQLQDLHFTKLSIH